MQFFLNVGPSGTFRPSGNVHTTPGEVDDFFKSLKDNPPENLTLFFHGGLVNETSGMIAAKAMADNLGKIGHTSVGVVWETGLTETISTNLTKISSKKLYEKVLKILLKRLSKKLGFDSIEGRGGGNFLAESEIEQELYKKNPFEGYDAIQEDSARGARLLDTMPEEFFLLNELEAEIGMDIQSDSYEIQEILNNEVVTIKARADENIDGSRGFISTAVLIKHLAKIGFRVIKRFVQKKDHGFYPTVIEELLREFYIAEIGSWVWGAMKNKSEWMWKTHGNRSGLERYAGRYFLDSLKDFKNENANIKINLVGHSAGSIAICNLLETIKDDYSDLAFNKIVFMAPACRIDLFSKSILGNKEYFKKIRVFTMSDDYEKNDMLVPYFYTRSLLYLISGILEEEGKEPDAQILGMERFLSRGYNNSNEALQQVHDYFLNDSEAGRISFSVTAPDFQTGLRTGAVSHGGFDEDERTLESINHFLSVDDE